MPQKIKINNFEILILNNFFGSKKIMAIARKKKKDKNLINFFLSGAKCDLHKVSSNQKNRLSLPRFLDAVDEASSRGGGQRQSEGMMLSKGDMAAPRRAVALKMWQSPQFEGGANQKNKGGE